MRRPWWTLRGLLTTHIPSGTRRCSGRQTSDTVAPFEPRNRAECGRRFPPSGLRWSAGKPRGAPRKPILRNGLGEIGPPVFLAGIGWFCPPAICQRRPQVSRGVGFRMPAGGDRSARCCGRHSKAPQEGTRGGWVSSLASMEICRGSVLGRGCAGRGNRRRIADRGRKFVAAAAVDGAILA
jgi:hypothetical protein